MLDIEITSYRDIAMMWNLHRIRVYLRLYTSCGEYRQCGLDKIDQGYTRGAVPLPYM